MSENKPEEHSPKKKSAVDTMHVVSDTVGFAPNIRLKDNVIQGIVVGAGTLLSALGAYLTDGSTETALLGALGGLIVFALLSGLVIMVLGWIRVMKR